jgi:hypothetical protein
MMPTVVCTIPALTGFAAIPAIIILIVIGATASMVMAAIFGGGIL